MGHLKNLLLIFGSISLLISCWPIRSLILQLPPGRTRRSWWFLLVLVCLFLLGYVGYTLIFWGVYRSSADLIVPLVFFFGAIFVFLVSVLSLQTVNNVKRIFVLEHESMTDPLMGICNRRCLEKRLYEEFSRAERYGHSLSLIMIDIDHFKEVNDNWGHQVGDIVLKRLAELIVKIVREADIVCRYGGEELVVILPHTKGKDAVIVAENLRVEIEKTAILTTDDNCNCASVQVTVSLGVATRLPGIDSVHDFLGQADKALYFAKKYGRNRTVCCSDLEDAKKC